MNDKEAQLGYLHRDIKPGNFAVGRPGTKDYHNIYLLDFGLCRKFVQKVWADEGRRGCRAKTSANNERSHPSVAQPGTRPSLPCGKWSRVARMTSRAGCE